MVLARKLLALPWLLAVGVLLAACGPEAPAAEERLEELQQQHQVYEERIAELEAALDEVRDEHYHFQHELQTARRVIDAMLPEIQPDAAFELTMFIDGYVDAQGARNPELRVEEGDIIHVTMINGEDVEHDLVIGTEVGRDEVYHSPHFHHEGETHEGFFIAPEAGEYVYYCAVPGHVEAGMIGTFLVDEADHEAH